MVSGWGIAWEWGVFGSNLAYVGSVVVAGVAVRGLIHGGWLLIKKLRRKEGR